MSLGYTTWAPRFIFRMKSASRGRSNRSRAPEEERSSLPSGCPMMSACGTTPMWYSKRRDGCSSTKNRLPFPSIRRAVSPS